MDVPRKAYSFGTTLEEGLLGLFWDHLAKCFGGCATVVNIQWKLVWATLGYFGTTLVDVLWKGYSGYFGTTLVDVLWKGYSGLLWDHFGGCAVEGLRWA